MSKSGTYLFIYLSYRKYCSYNVDSTNLVLRFSWYLWVTYTYVGTVSNSCMSVLIMVCSRTQGAIKWTHDNIINWKHFSRYWPFVQEIHPSPVNFPHKGQWRGASMFSLCLHKHGWVNNLEAGDLRHHRAHYDVIFFNELVSMNSEPVSCGTSFILPLSDFLMYNKFNKFK